MLAGEYCRLSGHRRWQRPERDAFGAVLGGLQRFDWWSGADARMDQAIGFAGVDPTNGSDAPPASVELPITFWERDPVEGSEAFSQRFNRGPFFGGLDPRLAEFWGDCTFLRRSGVERPIKYGKCFPGSFALLASAEPPLALAISLVLLPAYDASTPMVLLEASAAAKGCVGVRLRGRQSRAALAAMMSWMGQLGGRVDRSHVRSSLWRAAVTGKFTEQCSRLGHVGGVG